MDEQLQKQTNSDKPLKPLAGQTERVYLALKSGRWLTLPELHKMTNDPISSISAQIRHLRKPEFGSYTIKRRRRGPAEDGLFEYWLSDGE
jgi:hypothetical protein